MIITPKKKNFKFSLSPVEVPVIATPSGESAPTAWVDRSAPEHWVDGKDPWTALVASVGGSDPAWCIPLDWYKSCIAICAIGGDRNIQQNVDCWTIADEDSACEFYPYGGTIAAPGGDLNNTEYMFNIITMDTTIDGWKFRYSSDGVSDSVISQFWSYEFPGIILPRYAFLPPGFEPSYNY